jgi:hypothetical protein
MRVHLWPENDLSFQADKPISQHNVFEKNKWDYVFQDPLKKPQCKTVK